MASPDQRSSARPRRSSRGRPSAEGEAVGRETLIEAARRVLGRLPPAEVTRLAIAAEANVDPNLIRYYFGTVSQLISEVVLGSHRSIQEALHTSVPPGESAEWLRERIARLLGMFLDNPYHHQLLLQVMYEDTQSDTHAAWTASLHRTIRYIDERIREGVEQQAFRPVDARFLNLAMLGMTEFFANNAAIIKDVFGDDATPAELAPGYGEFLFDLLLNGLRPRD